MFALADEKLDLANFAAFHEDTTEEFQIYGLFPTPKTQSKCNFSEFSKNLKRPVEKGDTFTVTYTPEDSSLKVEGDALTSMVERKVKSGRYVPVVFLHWVGEEITVENL